MLKKFSIALQKVTIKQSSAFLVIVIVATVGTYLLINSHAATPYASITADNGTSTGGATVKKSCLGASDGNCMTFGFPITSNLAVHVKSGQLVNGQNQPLRLLGVDATGTEDACIQDKGFSWYASDSTEAAAMKTWHINAVRIPMNEDCWLGINGAPAAYSGVNYQNAMKNWVTALNNAGIVAILDLHWSAPGNYEATQQWSMADEDHSVTFWSQVASDYASDPAVMFDLYNEPTLGGLDPSAANWSCWLDGCDTSYTTPINGVSTTVDYAVAGMQQLVNTVRATGATQPLMLGGLAGSNDSCQSWMNNVIGGTCTQLAQMPTDPFNQLMISFHSYNFSWNKCITTTCWSSMNQAANKAGFPLVTDELGEDDCSDAYMNNYMDWADQNNVSYLAWAWQVGNPPDQPCVAGYPEPQNGGNFSLLSTVAGVPSTTIPQGANYMNHLLQEAP
jgi:hypothetical protein